MDKQQLFEYSRERKILFLAPDKAGVPYINRESAIDISTGIDIVRFLSIRHLIDIVTAHSKRRQCERNRIKFFS